MIDSNSLNLFFWGKGGAPRKGGPFNRSFHLLIVLTPIRILNEITFFPSPLAHRLWLGGFIFKSVVLIYDLGLVAQALHCECVPVE